MSPAAILFLLPGLANSGTRFLIPRLPFVSLSLALVFMQWQWLGLLVLFTHAVLCWRAALRRTPEEEILRRRGADYEISVLLDKFVPKGEPILCLSGCPRAYNHSEIIQGFGSARSDLLKFTIWSAVFDHMVPVWRHEYLFPEVAARGIRLVQTEPATNPEHRWSLSEVRSFSGATELRPSRNWLLAAWPNPWEVRRAFDGNPVSCWDTWERRKPGYFVEARFGREERLDRVLVECSHEHGADGVRWLVYQKGDWGYDDFVKDLAGWGATPIVEKNGYTLFRLD